MDHVVAKDGNIILEDSSGKMSYLTQTGRDSDPWLSADGGTAVFLRHPAEDIFRNSVYEIDLGTHMVKLLYAGPAKYDGHEISSFSRPELDAAKDTLFLLTNEYATEGSVIAVSLSTGQARLISDHAVGYDVVRCPDRYRGDLIVLKRQEQDILGRPYFLYYLYSAEGTDLGLAGDGELGGNLDFIRDGSCEEPAQPSVPSSQIKPPPGNTLRVEGSVMDNQLITRIEPIYPRQAQSEHIQGDVRLQIRIGADGTVQDASLVSGPPQLVAAAIAAVRQWKYRPASVSGHLAPVVTIVNVEFRLPSTGK